MKLRISELDFDVLWLYSSAFEEVEVCLFYAPGRLDDSILIYFSIYWSWILFLLGDFELKRRDGPLVIGVYWLLFPSSVYFWIPDRRKYWFLYRFSDRSD